MTETREIEININWQYATKCYIEILRNPRATLKGKEMASKELMRLAKYADAQTEEEKK